MKLFFGQIFPEILIDSDEQQHITKVLRMREGEEIFVTDGNGNLAKGNLVFEGKKASLNIDEIKENLPDFSDIESAYAWLHGSGTHREPHECRKGNHST